MRRGVLAGVLSEGYCCIYGYLRLCKARGEKPEQMAENLGVTKKPIYRFYKLMEEPNSRITCQRWKSCMKADIEAVEKLCEAEKQAKGKAP